jgi:hypothetical protein
MDTISNKTENEKEQQQSPPRVKIFSDKELVDAHVLEKIMELSTERFRALLAKCKSATLLAEANKFKTKKPSPKKPSPKKPSPKLEAAKHIITVAEIEAEDEAKLAEKWAFATKEQQRERQIVSNTLPILEK